MGFKLNLLYISKHPTDSFPVIALMTMSPDRNQCNGFDNYVNGLLTPRSRLKMVLY